LIRACLLAFIAGNADTVGFLRFDAFAGLMTGNTILLGTEIARHEWGDAVFHAGIIAIFLVGVILSRLILRAGWPVWNALSIAAMLLVLCSFLEKGVAALVLPLAMGMQNSAANRFNGVALNTVFITGNIQKIGEGLLAWAWPSRDAKVTASEGVAIFALVWISYASGALAGAIAERTLAKPLLLPAAILPIVMLSTPYLPRRRPRAYRLIRLRLRRRRKTAPHSPD
jgi:uncharacterized membrane protein YoaK (UPF0700 family)